ncbi:MAG: ABC transporter permease [Oceanipulchritudo sp.]
MNADPARKPGLPWILRMSWRDSRGKRFLLLLFTCSIVFGIGAIVAVYSLRDNLERIVDEQARSLLGADAVLQVRRPPVPALEKFISRLPGEKVREMRFRSMAVFPASGESRFVQVRAVDGALPFHGRMETAPARAEEALKPSPGKAIVEESLLLQMQLSPGDTVRLGNSRYEIEAALVRMAGESEITGFFAPRIYIPMQGLEETGLVRTGSIVRYRTHVGCEPQEVETLERLLQTEETGLLVEESVEVETVKDRRQSIEDILNNLLDFLNLIGFVALLLGGIGIIGAVNVYLGTKRETIAILRCLGSGTRAAFSIYLCQMLAFGLCGALAGTLIGVAAQFYIPVLLGSFLPFEIEMRLSPGSILTGLVFGWLVVTASALIPLLSIRHISPLQAIRSAIENGRGAARDPLSWLTGGVLLSTLLGFTVFKSREPLFAIGFIGGLGVALLLLWLLAWGLRSVLRRLQAPSIPYAARIALGNLYRPNNRTLLMTVSLGMGVLLINTLLLTRDGLLQQVRIEPDEDAANVILIDVQPDQREGVLELLEAQGFRPRDVLPVITMRVSKIKGLPLSEWKAEPDSPVSDWVYTWEFRNTYRDTVLDNAEVVAGEFTARHSGDEPFPVSLSANVVEDFGVGIGDSITWDIQGVEVETVVGSIRDVRWRAGRQNFNVVFPLQTIEEAPTVYAVSVKSGGRLETSRLQSALAGRFSNVSLIDLSLVLDSIRGVLDKAAFVIKFMAGFTVATGLIVLAGALLGNRYQRIRESVLFRTLGSSAGFIRMVLTMEFLMIGVLASLAGILLSWAAAGALFHAIFKLPLQINPPGSLLVVLVIVFLTTMTGWLTSRGIARHPPLVILRKE